jgi:hypothetical protein
MPSWAVPILVLVIILVDLVILLFVLRAVSPRWNDPLRDFPPLPPAPDAVRRNFQSFRVDALNLGWCVHVAVDQGHLHLLPARLPRATGFRAASVPWDRITPVGPAVFKSFTVAINRTNFTGPVWALRLADPSNTIEAAEPGRDP